MQVEQDRPTLRNATHIHHRRHRHRRKITRAQALFLSSANAAVALAAYQLTMLGAVALGMKPWERSLYTYAIAAMLGFLVGVGAFEASDRKTSAKHLVGLALVTAIVAPILVTLTNF